MSTDEAERLACASAGNRCIQMMRDPVSNEVMTLENQRFPLEVGRC